MGFFVILSPVYRGSRFTMGLVALSIRGVKGLMMLDMTVEWSFRFFGLAFCGSSTRVVFCLTTGFFFKGVVRSLCCRWSGGLEVFGTLA